MRLDPKISVVELCAALTLLVASGCFGRGNVDLLEARLRDQEDRVRSLQSQVSRTQSELLAARRLNESLNRKVVSPGNQVVQAELLEQQFRVSGLKVNTLLSGGFDRDGSPGDDQLTLHFSPVDDQGRTVRVPGTVACELFESGPSNERRRIGEWSFDEQQTNAAWLNLLGTAGFRLELPWQTAPKSPDLEVLVRFRSIHGDEFKLSNPVRVVLSE